MKTLNNMGANLMQSSTPKIKNKKNTGLDCSVYSIHALILEQLKGEYINKLLEDK